MHSLATAAVRRGSVHRWGGWRGLGTGTPLARALLAQAARGAGPRPYSPQHSDGRLGRRDAFGSGQAVSECFLAPGCSPGDSSVPPRGGRALLCCSCGRGGSPRGQEGFLSGCPGCAPPARCVSRRVFRPLAHCAPSLRLDASCTLRRLLCRLGSTFTSGLDCRGKEEIVKSSSGLQASRRKGIDGLFLLPLPSPVPCSAVHSWCLPSSPSGS